MGSAYDEMRGLRADLEKTDLKIVPMEIGGHVAFDSGAHWLPAYGVGRHAAGTLASILLLSLVRPSGTTLCASYRTLGRQLQVRCRERSNEDPAIWFCPAPPERVESVESMPFLYLEWSYSRIESNVV